MAGTIVVDRIESDASYTSTINVANRITFSNTVNFGVFAGTAPVAGFYLPTTNNLAFTTASTERMRIDSSGNVGIGTNSPTGDGTALHINASTYATLHFTNSTTGTTVSDGSDIITVGSDILFRNRETAAIQFATTGTERMRIDTSGNVGIGTSSMSNRLEVVQSASADASAAIRAGTNGYAASLKLIANDATGSRYNTLNSFYGSTEQWSIRSGAADSTMTFCTGSSATERMRIDSSGNLQLGSTSPPEAGRLFVSSTSLSAVPFVLQQTAAGATNYNSVIFYRNAASTGSISATATTTAYNTSSDYRLKENVQPMQNALAKIAALKPCTYTWKLNGSLGEGFIAHELAEVVPQAVNGEKNAVDSDGKIIPQGIDTSFLVATLTAAIQEQQALITSLTARITALESN